MQKKTLTVRTAGGHPSPSQPFFSSFSMVCSHQL